MASTPPRCGIDNKARTDRYYSKCRPSSDKYPVPSANRANARATGPADQRRWGRIFLLAFVWLLVGGGLGFGYYQVRSYVDRRLVFPIAPPRVVLVNQPAWMSDRLATQIIESVRPGGTYSAFDQQMLIDMAGLLQSNPWVRRVNQVRRVYGKWIAIIALRRHWRGGAMPIGWSTARGINSPSSTPEIN
jgi:hypothetical protein